MIPYLGINFACNSRVEHGHEFGRLGSFTVPRLLAAELGGWPQNSTLRSSGPNLKSDLFLERALRPYEWIARSSGFS